MASKVSLVLPAGTFLYENRNPTNWGFILDRQIWQDQIVDDFSVTPVWTTGSPISTSDGKAIGTQRNTNKARDPQAGMVGSVIGEFL